MTAADTLAELEHVVAAVAESIADERVLDALRSLQRPAPKGSAAWTAAMRERPVRLAAIAEAVASQGMSMFAVAEKIEAVAEGYRRSGWRRDCQSIGTPEGITGRPEAECWWMLRHLGAIPANSTIRAELSDWYKKRNPANHKP